MSIESLNKKGLLFDSVVIAYLLTVFWVVALQPSPERIQDVTANALMVSGFLLFGALFNFGLARMGVLTVGQNLFLPPHLKGKGEVRKWYATFWGLELAFAFVVTFIIGLQVTGFSIYELMNEQGFAGAKRVFTALANPNWDILGKGILAIVQTVYIAFIATVIAIPIAFLLAFFAAKNIMDKSQLGMAVYFGLRTSLNVVRSIEPLIWAIVFSVWVGIGPFAGMLALMIHSIASLTKQYSEIIEAVDDGPIEGIMATGANPIQTIWFAIVPQVVLPYISFTVYRWDINVRMATIIGLVGGGGIGTMLIQYQGQAMWNEVGTLALLIVAVVWTMDTASAYIREALK